MIRTPRKAVTALPSAARLLFVALCLIFMPGIAHSENLKAPQPYVLELFKHHDLVVLGTTHRKPPILKFINDLIPHLNDAGVTHIGFEIPTDQQGNIDNYMNTGNGLMDIYLHPQIECPEYRGLLKTLHSLDPAKRPSVVTLDLPKNLYGGKISRDEWMARTIADGVPGNPATKFLVIVGNFHVFKMIDWQDHVPNKTGSIREYLDRLAPGLRAYSIGQVIDQDPDACDFTRVFGPAKGAVAMDCQGERFNGWKIGVTSAIAIKDTEPCQLFDGLIVY
jgi:hypothetical protein